MRRTLATLALFATAHAAHAGCLPITGTVELAPDPGCKVKSLYPVGTPFGNECFSVTLKLGGWLPAYGYAGVTAEVMTSEIKPNPVGAATLTPATVQGGRELLTARSTLNLLGTTIYSAEVIVDSNGFVTEQSVITGTNGLGLMKNASGGFAVLGDSREQPAQVRGQICTP